VEYLTVEQAAELLQVKPRTVRQYIYDGKLKAANVGSTGPGTRYRIPRIEIDNFIYNMMNDDINTSES